MTSIDQSQFKRVLRFAIILPLILMSIVAAVLLWQINDLLTAVRWVEQANVVISQANLLQRLIVDRQTAMRGYLINGNSEFLAPYEAAERELPQTFERLSATITDAGQDNRLLGIEKSQEPWAAFARETIALRERGDAQYMNPERHLQGKSLMDATRRQLNDFINAEETLRDERKQLARNHTRRTITASLFLTLVFGGVLAFFGRHQLTSLSQSYATMFEKTLKQSIALQNQATTLQEQADDLKESNSRTINILESIGDAFVALDRDWRFTYINPRASMLLARPATELNGKVLWDEIPVLRGTIFEIELRATADESRMHRFEADFPNSDRAIEISVYPAEDGLSIYFNDITERRSAEREQKLAEAEQSRLRESIINLQRARLEELAAPLIPLRQGIVLMPLIGSLDSERAAQVLNNLSHGVVEHAARVCILDITGVPTVDSNVAATLLNAAQTVRLLGAEVVITGIRSGVAQTLIRLGVDIKGITTRSTLNSGLDFALTRLAVVNDFAL